MELAHDATTQAVCRLVEAHGADRLAGSLRTAADLVDRLDEVNGCLEELSTELSCTLQPQLVGFSRRLPQMLDDLQAARWQRATMARLVTLWRQLDDIERHLATKADGGGQLTLDTVCAMCRQVAAVGADIDRLGDETGGRLDIVATMRRRCGARRTELVQRLLSEWRRTVRWRWTGRSQLATEHGSGAAAAAAAITGGGIGDARAGVGVSAEQQSHTDTAGSGCRDCTRCVDLVVTPTESSDHCQLLSALQSMSVLDSLLAQLGKRVQHRLIASCVRAAATQRRICVRRVCGGGGGGGSGGGVVLSSHCARCHSIHCDSAPADDSSCSSANSAHWWNDWADVFTTAASVSGDGTSGSSSSSSGSSGGDEAVARLDTTLRQVAAIVACVRATVLADRPELMRLVWQRERSGATEQLQQLADLLANSRVLAEAAGHVTDVTRGRRLAAGIVTSVEGFDRQLTALGHPEGGRLTRQLLLSRCVSSSSSTTAAAAGCGVGTVETAARHPAEQLCDAVASHSLADAVCLDMFCSNQLAAVRQALLTVETVEHNTDIVDDIGDGGGRPDLSHCPTESLKDLLDKIDLQFEPASFCRDTNTDLHPVSDDSVWLSRDKSDSDRPAVLPAFVGHLECASLFHFPRCLVWHSAIAVVAQVESLIDSAVSWPCSLCSEPTPPSSSPGLSTGLEDRQSSVSVMSPPSYSGPVGEKSHWPTDTASAVEPSVVATLLTNSVGRPRSGRSSELCQHQSAEHSTHRHGDAPVPVCQCRPARHRLLLCVRQCLELCTCLLNQRLQSIRAGLSAHVTTATSSSGGGSSSSSSSSDTVNPVTMRHLAVTHNSCHWLAYRTLLMTAVPRRHWLSLHTGSCGSSSCHSSGAGSPFAVWLSAAVELRQLGSDWLRLAVHSCSELLQRLMPAVSRACTPEQLQPSLQLLQQLHSVWSAPQLPVVVSEQLLGLFSANLVDKFCQLVLHESDISTASCSRLLAVATSCLSDTQLPYLQTAAAADSWRRFRHLCQILDSSLADIGRQWTDGTLSHSFSGEQLKHLVRALFRNTDRRAALLASIK